MTIAFDPKTFATPQTINLNAASLDLNGNTFGPVTILGPAAGLTPDAGVTVNGSLDVGTGVTAIISGLTLSATLSNFGVTTLRDSTITGSSGDGVFNSPLYNGSMTIENCTIAANQELGIISYGPLTILDSSIIGNGVNSGDDVASGIAGAFTLGNTIVAENVNGDVRGSMTSLGHNLIGNTAGSTGWLKTDLTGTEAYPLNPKLSALGSNGGATPTQIPLPGSPAIGAGSVALIPAGVTTDERGLPRVVDGKVDIGAVEVQPAAS